MESKFLINLLLKNLLVKFFVLYGYENITSNYYLMFNVVASNYCLMFNVPTVVSHFSRIGFQ